MFETMGLREVRYNRSYPLDSDSEAFDFCNPDPRPIDADLDMVSISWDPRALLCVWRKMEQEFDIAYSPLSFGFLSPLQANAVEGPTTSLLGLRLSCTYKEKKRGAVNFRRKEESSRVGAFRIRIPLKQ